MAGEQTVKIRVVLDDGEAAQGFDRVARRGAAAGAAGGGGASTSQIATGTFLGQVMQQIQGSTISGAQTFANPMTSSIERAQALRKLTFTAGGAAAGALVGEGAAGAMLGSAAADVLSAAEAPEVARQQRIGSRVQGVVGQLAQFGVAMSDEELSGMVSEIAKRETFVKDQSVRAQQEINRQTAGSSGAFGDPAQAISDLLSGDASKVKSRIAGQNSDKGQFASADAANSMIQSAGGP
jgi:hypothetical protein